MSAAPLIICEHCEAVWRRPSLAPGEVADCGRCGAALAGDRGPGVTAGLALTLTAMLAFLAAVTQPILALEVGGQRSEVTLWGAVLATWDDSARLVAVACALCVLLVPMLELVLFAHVLGALQAERRPRGFGMAMHALRILRHWSMVEVFVLGVVVSAVKLTALAEVLPGAGTWGFGLLTLAMTELATIDLPALWERAEAIGQ